jgi:hypothetical protein
VIGVSAAAAVEKGVVLIKLPGPGNRFVPLTGDVRSIPFGSTVDATKGQVRMTTAADATGKAQVGHFGQGRFIVKQGRKNPLTTLQMSGGNLKACQTKLPRGGAPKATAAARRGRRLFSNVKGRFRTRGRNSSATVRGTQWLQKDTCAGTKTTVMKGSVVVRDLRLRKNHVVKAGHSYFARSKPLKKRR